MMKDHNKGQKIILYIYFKIMVWNSEEPLIFEKMILIYGHDFNREFDK